MARRRSSEEIYTSDRIYDSYKQIELQTLEAQMHRALCRALAVHSQKPYRLGYKRSADSVPGSFGRFNCVPDSPSKRRCCRTS